LKYLREVKEKKEEKVASMGQNRLQELEEWQRKVKEMNRRFNRATDNAVAI